MKRYLPIYIIACVVTTLGILGYLLFSTAHFDVLSPAGAISKQQQQLLMFAATLSLLVVLPVFTLLGLFAWKYRAGAHGKHSPEWGENRALEALVWGLPILIIIVLAVVTWRTSHTLDPYRPIQSETKTLEVQVVALQWKWLFLYPELGVASVNKLVVPEQTPVHFTLTADAPMSAFWVPALGTQIYAMNGMSSQLNLIADRAGTFNGYTTNINGKGYADMKFVVDAREKAGFDEWATATSRSTKLMDEGEYKKLAEPGTTDVAMYALKNTSLYDTIVNKYMSGHEMNHSMEHK
ncbi:MAG: COX aromatic rich motif-containing protein [Candidatus Saccharimonas sp.]